jgi:hypothetical protein
MEPLSQLIATTWGPIKTGKSTLALTWPKPMVHMDFDQGFHRAEPNFLNLKVVKVPLGEPLEKWLPIALGQGAEIITKPYPLPVKWGSTVAGYIDLWNEIVGDLKVIYENQYVQTLCMDTGSVFWEIRVQAQLEKAQQRNATRTRLQEIEYGEPNSDMRAMLGACRTYGKNLITVHHVGGVYEPKLTAQGTESVRVGDTYSGWKHTGALVDIILKTNKIEAVNGQPAQIEAMILTCGLTLAAEGQVVPDASFESILALVNSLRGANGGT